MNGHPHREPRAHWLLLALSLSVLFGLLCLDGYATAPVGDRTPVGDVRGRSAVAPSGEPVRKVAADGTLTGRATPARTIALTFEDGPDPRWTPQILQVLARHHARATFFVLGSRVNRYPRLSQQIVASGHEIGSHGFSHVALSAASPARRDVELALSGNAIAAVTGRRPVLLSPPLPSTSASSADDDLALWRQASQSGYLTVLADRDASDTRGPDAAAIVAAATPPAGRGAVVRMHDSGGDRSTTIAALDLLIPRLQAAGYEFTTVSHAIGLDPAPAADPGQRWRGYGLALTQASGSRLAGFLAAIMAITVAVGVVRLVVQVAGARRHERLRRRRTDHEPPRAGLVSVIVPAYNEAANIEGTVRSILRSDYPELEIVVVDDGSTDATAEIVTRLALPAVTMVRQVNAGKPAALDNGIRHARGDVLVFVDGDTVLEAGTVARLLRPMEDPQVGAVSGYPKVVNRTGLLGRWQHLEYVAGFNLDRRMLDVAGCLPTIPGAIGAFRRSAVHDAGGVSAQTLAEDTDLTMALIRSGWQVRYEPAAVAWTEAPSTLRQLWRQRYRWSYGTMQVLWKHRYALREGGHAGRLGRYCLPYLAMFQVLFPLLAPAVDVYGLYGLLFQPFGTVAAAWVGFTAVQMAVAAYTLRLDGESCTYLWAVPLQQVLYRQLNYLVVVQSLVMALTGARLRWHRMHRTGAAAAHAHAAHR